MRPVWQPHDAKDELLKEIASLPKLNGTDGLVRWAVSRFGQLF